MASRWLAGLSVLGLALGVAFARPAHAQTGVKATVTFVDPETGEQDKSESVLKSESPAGIELTTGEGEKLYPSDQIIDVTYKGLPGVPLDQLIRLGLQENEDPVKAAAGYSELASKATGVTRRVLEYRAALANLKVTNQKTGTEFEAAAAATADLLSSVAKSCADSWEVWPATHAAARIRKELGQFDRAAELYAQLAAVPNLPAELQSKVRISQVGALLRAGKTAEANAVLGELKGRPEVAKPGPLRDALGIYETAATAPTPGGAAVKPPLPSEFIAKLEAAISQANDPSAKAAGYGVLGDLYDKYGSPREAMWSYLWVDLVYPMNRDERVIAVRRLPPVFTALGEIERAGEYREKLPGVR